MGFSRRHLLGSGLLGACALAAPGLSEALTVRPRMRLILDNDFSGDPDGLFQLAHHLRSPSVEVRAIIGSHLHADEKWAKSEHQATDGANKARELLEVMGLTDKVSVHIGSEKAMVSATVPARSAAVDAIIAEAMRDDPLPLFAPRAAPEMGAETIAPLPLMPASQDVVADYQTLRLSLKGYPTQFLRPLLEAEGIVSCGGLAALPDGARARVAGIVLVRQRPGKGTAIFITLSDETGVANLVLWQSNFPRYRKEVMGARFLLAEGKVQKSPDGVLHLMVEHLVDRSADLRRLYDDTAPLPPPAHRHPRNVRIVPPSRDFH